MKPGIYPGLPMADYLAIDALSTTPVRKLVEECDRAGWWHSRLNPQRPPADVGIPMDVGSAAHSVFLEDSWACVVEIDPALYPNKTKPFNIPKGFTNDAIKEARDAVRAAGKYPILKGGGAEIQNMVTAAREFVASLEHTEPAIWRAFQPNGGHSETVIVWDDDGLLCKLRTDRASNDWGVVCDYKTSGVSVEPDRWGRTQMSSLGHHFGSAWYRRGIRKTCGADPTLVYLCQEVEAPYLCSLIGVDPAGVSFGDEKVAYGLRKWKDCLASGVWSGYQPRVYYPMLSAWESMRWEEQKIGFPYDPAVLFGEKK